jgi:hypothetical protein
VCRSDCAFFKICRSLCETFTSLRHGFSKTVPKLEAFFGRNINHEIFDFPLEYTKERFIHRCLSSSYAPEPDTAAYHQYIEQLWVLMDEFAPDSEKIIVPNVTVAYWGKLY